MRVVPPERITVIVNTADDLQYLGLHVSPDIDSVTYALAGIADVEKGWGIAEDTYNCLEQLAKYSAETWFRIGDRDFATHLLRTAFLQQGFTLTEVTEKMTTTLGVKVTILPMTDDPVATKIKTPDGTLEFQEYFVKRRFRDKVENVTYQGASNATPAPGVLSAIDKTELIIFCPSNPILSIGPILALPDIRKAVAKSRAKIVGISPIVGGRSIKGPLDRMMENLGLEVSPFGVAQLYKGLMRGYVIDEVDRSLSPKIEEIGMRVISTRTIMDSQEAKVRLAEETLKLAETLS